MDGIVVEGESLIDTAALTGESVPRSAKAGDEDHQWLCERKRNIKSKNNKRV